MAIKDIPPDDRAEVEAIVLDYISSWYDGDADRMARSLHDDLTKRIPDPEGQLREVSKARMVSLTESGDGVSPDASYEIHVDDVAGNIATARVLSPDYLDYVHIARTADGWKIVNILFRTSS